jgi:hypothetical protein
MLRIASTALTLSALAFAQDAGVDIFESKIRPVLAARCYACHNSSMASPQGGLRLDSTQSIRQGGNSGAIIQSGEPDRSLLLRALRYTDKTLKMPPGKPLAPEAVANFEAWIRAGAPMPAGQPKEEAKAAALWSLQKPQTAPIPNVRDQHWIRNDIDSFVLHRLDGKGLTPAPEAGKRTLIRRATFDLTGLPPTAEEIDRFLHDNSPQSYERLIDRLLASPRYGERWGRHWLDVARYADSVNDSVNAGQRYAWSYTYRDWVIRALNEDLPYDKFLQYQLAADRIPNTDPRNLAALGFLSLGREFPNSFPETVDDRIDAVTRGMMGFTVACARCHDHKYDPIPTKDYYSLYSIFSNIREPKQLPLLTVSNRTASKQEMYTERLERIEKDLQSYRSRRNAEMIAFFKTQSADYLLAARDSEKLSNTEVEELVRDRQLNAHVLAKWRKYLNESRNSGEPVFQLWHAAAAIPDKEFAAKWSTGVKTSGNPLVQAEAGSRTIATLKDLAAAYAAILAKHDRPEPFPEPAAEQLRAVLRGAKSPVEVPLDEFELICTEGDNNNLRSIRVRYNTMLAQSAYDGAPARAMSVEDVPHPKPAHVFLRGNANNPGALTPPHFLSCLGGSEANTFQDGSGRLELARAIADPENPLTARVIVNRVWMHHFGFGLVRTPSDFGFRGDRPTHPELLDYLALKFVDSGWSLKKLHRLIMTSATYRQASADNEAARKIDPENQLLWRMNRRRLEIESLRDSMLAVAGRLDLTAGGVPFALTALPSTPRRSVYGFIERGRVPGMLSAFDFASPDQHAPMRHVTTVPQQALFLLNSPFVAEQAAHVVERPDIRSAADTAERIKRLYRAVLGRAPEQWEVDAGLKFVAQAGNSNAEATTMPVWQYGIGEYRVDTGKISGFTPFSTFIPDRWQGGPALPAADSGKAVLTPTGGEAGERPNQAAVRRWTSPVSGKINIEGTLRHGQPAVPYGDGVRGRIISSRLGELASWSVNGSSAETKLNGITVQPGDTIDFIVDARVDPESDGFGWAPSVKQGDKTWSAKDDFAGPASKPLNAWARYAQVLLETNEFAFVD